MGLAEIGNKIFDKEVKLSREEVELGVVDDINKLTGDAKSMLSEASSFIKKEDSLWSAYDKKQIELDKAEKEALKVTNTAPKLQSKMQKLADRMVKVYEKAENAAKELGVSTKDIKGFGTFEDVFDDLEKGIDKVDVNKR